MVDAFYMCDLLIEKGQSGNFQNTPKRLDPISMFQTFMSFSADFYMTKEIPKHL